MTLREDLARWNSDIARSKHAYHNAKPTETVTKPHVGPVEKAAAVRAYLSGTSSLIELGLEYGVHADTVGNWARAARRECC